MSNVVTLEFNGVVRISKDRLDPSLHIDCGNCGQLQLLFLNGCLIAWHAYFV